MIEQVASQVDEIATLCRRFGVRRLDVFGSAVGGDFRDGSSDVDFLVELDPPEGQSRFDAFFGLKESLELLLGMPVDLVDRSALRNPFFAAGVESSRTELYAADLRAVRSEPSRKGASDQGFVRWLKSIR